MQSTQPAGALRTLAIACAVFLSAGVVLASFGPSLPRLAANVGYDIAALGGLFTAISGGVVLAQFGAGPGSDRFGQRAVLAGGMLLMGPQAGSHLPTGEWRNG